MNKKALIFGGGAIAVVAIVVALIFIFTGGEDAYRSIKVFEIDGTCTVERDGDNLDAFKNMSLSSGDTLTVGEGSFARLKLDDDKYVYLEANTKINLTATGTANDSKTMVYIERGSMLTEVKKKLSATSSYDIVTPNTTMSIRGTKTLTEVYEDVLGAIRTSAAVVEGQVKFSTIQKDKTGKAVIVSTDLTVGQGYGVTTESQDLLSEDDVKHIADDGKTVDGKTAEETTHEELGSVLETPAFSDEFLTNIVAVLARSRDEDIEEGFVAEDISEEELNAAINVLNDVIDGKVELPDFVEEYIISQSQPYYSEPVVVDTPVTNDVTDTGSVQNVDPEPVIADEPEEVDEDTVVVDGTGESLVRIDDDADDADDAVVEDDESDDQSDEADDTDDESDDADADDEDGEDVDTEDDDDVDADDVDDEKADDADVEDDEDKEEEEQPEETTEEPEDETESQDTDSDAENNQSSSQTYEPVNSPKPVTYSYSRSFSTSSQGSTSEQDTVSLVFKQGSEVISADMLPSSYAVNSPLPGSNGSNYSVSIDSDHAAEYQFTGWYVTEQLAQEADPAKSVANMPSSSSSNVPLYAGIRKIPVKITITNMYPHAGRFYAPERDSAGHEYALTGESEQYPNLLTITGYEYGDEFALPEECRTALSLNNGDLSGIPYVGGFTATDNWGDNHTTDKPYYPLNLVGDYEEDSTLFYGYSTASTANLMEIGGFLNRNASVSDLQAYHPVENGVEGEMYYNYNSYDYVQAFGEGGQGVNTRISLTADALEYNDQDNSYVLKLYAYFGTYVSIYLDDDNADKMILATSDGDKKLFELPEFQNISVIENSASGERTRIWRIEYNELTTMKQDSYSVAIPEFKTDTSVNLDKYTVRLADRGLSGGLHRLGEGKSYVNNGSLKVDESFFENGPATAVQFEARLTKYVVLDLDIDLTVNHLGDMNRYYIKEVGDSDSKKYKMAVVEYEWDTDYSEPSAQQVGWENYYAIEYDYTLVGAPESIDAFTFGQSSGNTKIRNYVMVPDDAYYPWGMKGVAKFSDDVIEDVDQDNYEDHIGTELYSKLSYVGDPFGKLYGYSVSYGYGDNRKTVNALYSEQNRGVPNDYSIIVKTKDTQAKSVGVLLSIGLDGELFDDSTPGQVVLRPLMGPHKQPFWFSLIYDYAGYKSGDYSYAVYPDNIADGYRLRITLSSPGNIGTLGIGNGDLKCEWLKSTSGYTEGPIDLSKISWEWKVANDFSAENYKARYMVGNTLYEVTPVEDNTGFLNYDIPLKHLLNDWDDYELNFVRGLVPSSSGVNFTNVFMKQNQSEAGTPYSGDNLSLIPVNGNYVPCAFDVRVSESEVCKFTGFVGVVGEGGSSLRRVVQESDSTNCEFEEYTVVDDFEFQTGTGIYFGSYGPDWGAYVYSSWGNNAAKLYGYYSEGSIVPISYSKLLTYNTEGNIYNALHGEDNKRYGGVLICLGIPCYVKFANDDLSSITLYSYENGTLSVASDTGFMSIEKYYIGSVDSNHYNTTMLKLNGKLYMRILHGEDEQTSYLVEITEDGASGSAIVDEFYLE